MSDICLIESPITHIVLAGSTVVIPMHGMRVIPQLHASDNVDFYVFSEEEYRRLPSGHPFQQWHGSDLTGALTLPGNRPWYLIVANRNSQPIQLSGFLCQSRTK